MDNNIQPINIDNTFQFINNTYDNLSYFDLYGNSVFIFIFITLFVFFVYSYCKIMQTKKEIADDWVNQRCKPQIMPFAGFINRPEGTSAFKYSRDNFEYCVQDILKSIMGQVLQPFQYMISVLTQLFMKFNVSIQQTREANNRLRNGIREFAEDVLTRILNIVIPIQKMFISVIDIFQKIQGTMTAGLYTMLGSYYTLQALMGAIVELIIKILISLVIIIMGLWVMPLTWPAAASMSAVFLAVSIPLAIIVYFMKEVLHVKSSEIPKLRCFDRKTRIYLQDGTFKHIEDICLDDVFIDGSRVTAKIKVTSKDLDMYNLNGIIVSESHIVNHCGNWIPVKRHPLAIKLEHYDEPYLYCLNTTSKTIVIHNIVFTDWDEIYDDDLDFVMNYDTAENVNKLLNVGFKPNALIKMKHKEHTLIQNIQIGDILSTGGVVYGTVEIKNHERNLGNNPALFNLLVSDGRFEIGTVSYFDYNKNIDYILELKKNII